MIIKNIYNRVVKLLSLPDEQYTAWRQYNLSSGSIYKNIINAREEIDKKLKSKYPIRFFLNRVVLRKIRNLSYKLENKLYYLKCHLIKKHKYHIIDIRSADNTTDNYKYGWIESDKKIYLAATKILEDFVEQECDGETIDDIITHTSQMINILEIYHTHKITRPKLYAKLNEATDNYMCGKTSIKEINNIEKELDNLEDSILSDIVKFRRYMWA